MDWLLKNHQRDFESVRSDDKNCKRLPQITGNKKPAELKKSIRQESLAHQQFR